MQAALSLASRGVPVHLVEKEAHLGGYLGNQVEHTVDGLGSCGNGIRHEAEGV